MISLYSKSVVSNPYICPTDNSKNLTHLTVVIIPDPELRAGPTALFPIRDQKFCNDATTSIHHATMDRPEVVEPPQKRQKTDVSAADAIVDVLPKIEAVEDAQAAKEREVGITELVTGNIDGFSGTLKKRCAVLSRKILPLLLTRLIQIH